MTTAATKTPTAAALSPREREVLELLARGCRVRQAAHELGLSPETVQTHIRNAMRKLNARTRVQAVAIAVEAGVVSPARRWSAAP